MKPMSELKPSRQPNYDQWKQAESKISYTPPRDYYGKDANYMSDTSKELSGIRETLKILVELLKEQQLTLEAHSDLLDEITAAIANDD